MIVGDCWDGVDDDARVQVMIDGDLVIMMICDDEMGVDDR